MKTLLRIDSSPRINISQSRLLADYFEKKWIENNPKGNIIRRDLATSLIPHLDNLTIEGFYTPLENMTQELISATSLSDELINEIKSSDDILISSPLYNLNIPSSLKAYIDQIMRINRTFELSPNGSKGLLIGRKAYIITSKGGVMKGTEMEKFDFQEPYLTSVLNYMGVRTEALFSLEGTAHGNLAELNIRKIKEIISSHFLTK